MKTDPVRLSDGAPPPGPAEPEQATSGRNRKVTILLLLFIVVMGSLWVVGPLVFAGRDDPTAIDNKTVRKTVLASCTLLRSDLDAVPAGVAPADRAEAENRAVEQLVGRVRAMGPDALARDVPVESWLADWGQIVAARRQAVRDRKPFTTPIAGGAPINVRMFALVRSGLGKCDVPPALLAPQPGRV